MQQTGTATRTGATGRIEVFEYLADGKTAPAPVWEGWGEEPSAPPHIAPVSEQELRTEFEKKLAEETRKSFEAGRVRGRQEGTLEEREAQAASRTTVEKHRMEQVAEWVEGFRQERERYFEAVEREVVELALAVAARILRREAQMDPLLLTGAVRVALGQIAHSTEARLRVPPDELELWTEAMALMPNLAVKPKVVAGAGMRLGDCAMETEMGTVDLGIRAQLSEIERGFFDRADGRKVETEAVAESPTQIPVQIPIQSREARP